MKSEESEEKKIQQVRSCFPAVESTAYFNTGTCGPLPEVCAQAMSQEIHNACRDGRGSIPEYMVYLEEVEALRSDLARLIGANTDEICITQHTTEAINHVLWGMNWQAGDIILTSTQEHPALLTPLALLHARMGVEVIYLPFNGTIDHDLALLERSLHPQVRMVALSHVSWVDGFQLPITEMAHSCRAARIPILVDGAQAIGCLPIHVKTLGVDFYAAPAQKWLCGPEGMGFLYIHKDWFSRLEPTFAGIFGVRNLSWFAQNSPHYVPAEGAKRFQQSGLFRPLVYGWRASLQLLEENIGWDWIFSRSQGLFSSLKQALETLPSIQILTPTHTRTNLLTLTWSGLNAKTLSHQLETQGIVVRDIPHDHTQRLRISVGFFNHETDIQNLVETLKVEVKR